MAKCKESSWRYGLLWFSWAVAAPLTGCMGEIGDSQSFRLIADSQKALQLEDCVAQKGLGNCLKYPNPASCDAMDIHVAFGQESQVNCGYANGNSTKAAVQSPFVWRKVEAYRCLQFLDVFGNIISDTCPAGAIDPPSMPQRSAVGQGASGASGASGAQAPSEVEAVLDKYAKSVNQLLAAEGIPAQYQATPPSTTPADPGLGNFLGFASQIMQGVCAATQGAQPQQNAGFCSGFGGENRVCQCAALASAATRMTCEFVKLAPTDPQVYAAVWQEMGKSVNWLMNLGKSSESSSTPPSSTPPSNSADIEQTPGTGTAPNVNVGQIISDIGTIASSSIGCMGDPLVLDLADDGFQFSAPEAGVEFDLHGHGQVQTAWVGAGDALLAIDRNMNGLIDDGSELFGEAVALDGSVSANGFQALALVDERAQGGNGNGKVDAGDRLFRKLRLWSDTNRDGVSQESELTTLTQSGIVELSLASTADLSNVDGHGNQLALQGTFQRKNGKTGKMVDVWLSYRPAQNRSPLVAASK